MMRDRDRYDKAARLPYSTVLYDQRLADTIRHAVITGGNMSLGKGFLIRGKSFKGCVNARELSHRRYFGPASFNPGCPRALFEWF